MIQQIAPRVYSYIRFSTPEQKMGDSERRQLDVAKRYAEQHGLPLDTSLRMLDEGLSGYHGANRKRGALGAFLRAIKECDVPRGSILLVENVDRLSREDFVEAFATISQIITAGIKIVTLSPQAEYTRESIAGGLIWQLVGQMQGAYEESKKKGERIRNARDTERKLAREEGRILTRMCPAWLTVKDGRFEVVPGAGKTLQLIFDLKLKGVGNRTIEARLNSNGYWKPPKNPKRMTGGWRTGYIIKILKNRAVIGEYQPHLLKGGRNGERIPIGEQIPGYFPTVVRPEVFHAVQQKRKANLGKTGRTGKICNLLTYLVKCAYCGGPMHFLKKGKSPRGRGYLICNNGQRGICCSRYSIRYDECEKLILENCQRLRPEQVLPNPNEQAARCQQLRETIQGHSGELADIEQQVDNLTNQIAKTKQANIRDRYEARIGELLERQGSVEKLSNQASHELCQLQAGTQSLTAWKQNLETLQAAVKTGDVPLRLRLRNHLQELIDHIEIFAVGHLDEYDPDTETGDNFAEWFEESVGLTNPRFKADKQFRAFVRHVLKLRMSKHGRFLRVHFKTGVQIDLVPDGSCASGIKELPIPHKGWKLKHPQLDRLWQEFSANGRATAKCH
jgi:DNA invertase Pin-like site-specific DNA recombinase